MLEPSFFGLGFVEPRADIAGESDSRLLNHGMHAIFSVQASPESRPYGCETD
jgi:hypothetical protein